MDNKLKHIIGILAGVVCFVIYLLTLHPSVTFIDSGELAAACYTFGVPHPTGYPIFLLLGYIVSHLPLPGSVIYKLNLLSAIESAAAVIVTYYSAIILSKYVFGKLSAVKSTNQTDKKLKKTIKPETDIRPAKRSIEEFNIIFYILGFITAVCMGLTKTFWFDATQIEVYALHSLFISILIYYSLKILTRLKEPVKKDWLILFLVFGLAMANHLTVIFFIPALLFMLYTQYSSDNNFTKKILPYGLLVLPGFLLYYILVISSSSVPYLNWSDLQNISNLPGHLSGSDFSQLMFSSKSKFSDNAASFIKNLPGEFAILPLIFSVAGLILLWRTFINFIIYISLSVIFTLFYSFNYNIIDISTYYLLAFYLISMAVPEGILFIVSLGKPAGILTGKNEPGSTRGKVIIAGLILVIFSVAYNYKENDNSTNYANVDYTLNSLNSLPQNSVLIVYEWSYIYTASLYYQLAEHVRPDVKVFIVKFLSVPWYLKMISKYYPDIYESIKTEAEDYEKTLGLSEKERAPKLSALVSAFIEKCSAKYPVFVSVDLVLSKEMKQFITGFTIKPIGTVYKLDKKNMPYDPTSGVDALNYSFRKFEPTTKQRAMLYKIIPGMLFETGYYHYNNKNNELSLKFMDKALEFDPSFRDALNLKSKIASQK